MGRIVITDNGKRFVAVNRTVMDNALNTMAGDVSNIAKSRVPFKEGDLFKEIRAVRIKILKHQVRVDSDYAAYQEAGERKDGSHVVRKYTTPSTGKNFLKGAGERVTSNALNYFKQSNQLIKL